MSGQNWQALTPYNIGTPGTPGRANSGAGYQAIGFRDVLDARRSMQGDRVPQAEYPDGYLGTITNRRQDKLLSSIQSRLTQRSYQRGVHKGERVDPHDYYWNEYVSPEAGIANQMRGLKWTASGDPVERMVNQGKNAITSPSEMARLQAKYGLEGRPAQADTIDPVRAEKLKRIAPSWR
jgi:hypothetical protein